MGFKYESPSDESVARYSQQSVDEENDHGQDEDDSNDLGERFRG